MKRTPRQSPASTALVPAARTQLAPPLGAAPPTPLSVFLSACSPGSRRTMQARLHAAAGILAPGSTAGTFHWAGLDYASTNQVLSAIADAGGAPATINLTRSALRKMAKVLFSLRMLDVEERQRIDDIPPTRGQHLPRRAFSAREIRKLFAACAKDATAAGRRDAAILACLFGGGLRRAEASKLDVADVRPAELHVRGKGRKERMQPIGVDTERAIAEWLDTRGSKAGPLFVTVSKHGKIGRRRLNGKAIEWKVRRRARESALDPKGASPHALRRAFGTGLLEAGEDLATVAKALGHASVTTTARCYDVRDGKQVAAAVAKLVVPFGRKTP